MDLLLATARKKKDEDDDTFLHLKLRKSSADFRLFATRCLYAYLQAIAVWAISSRTISRPAYKELRENVKKKLSDVTEVECSNLEAVSRGLRDEFKMTKGFIRGLYFESFYLRITELSKLLLKGSMNTKTFLQTSEYWSAEFLDIENLDQVDYFPNAKEILDQLKIKLKLLKCMPRMRVLFYWRMVLAFEKVKDIWAEKFETWMEDTRKNHFFNDETMGAYMETIFLHLKIITVTHMQKIEFISNHYFSGPHPHLLSALYDKVFEEIDNFGIEGNVFYINWTKSFVLHPALLTSILKLMRGLREAETEM